jgi:hypothetical protein
MALNFHTRLDHRDYLVKGKVCCVAASAYSA